MNPAARFVGTVPWVNLEHAYGPAADLPPLLENIARAKGRKLYKALDDLCSHVLHQGTIYSASPPVVHFLVAMLPDAAPREKAMLYGLLAAFADSARMAIEDGPAAACCAGGDPVDGAAIRAELADARARFESDLAHPNAAIRAQVAELLAFLAQQDAGTAQLLRQRYLAEDEPEVRHTILSGLAGLHTPFSDWHEFLERALQRESDPGNRFVLRQAQVRELKADAGPGCIDDLVSTFVRAAGSAKHLPPSEEGFFTAIHLLGRDRELASLLKALDLAGDEDLIRVLAERLLRLSFDDQRTGWGHTSYSRLNEDGSRPPQVSIYHMALRAVGMLLLAKLFPFVVRWRIRRLQGRKPKGIQSIRYSGLAGPRPDIPGRLSETQRAVLTAIAAKPEVWQFRTNLWDLFGLPDNAAQLQSFVETR